MWARYLKFSILVTACAAMAGCASLTRSTASNTYDVKLTPTSVSDSKPQCTSTVSSADQEIKVTNLTYQAIRQVSVDCSVTVGGITVTDPGARDIPGRRTRSFMCNTKDFDDPPDGTRRGTTFKLTVDVDGQVDSWDVPVVCTTQPGDTIQYKGKREP